MEAIYDEVLQMSPEERDRTLVELIKVNTELASRLSREVARPRQILMQLVDLLEDAEGGKDVQENILATIRFYRDNY